MVLTPLWLSALLAASQGEVKLPLAEYLALVESAEEAERAASLRAQNVEPVVAELAAQRTSIVWEGSSAAITTTYEVQLRGLAAPGVVLPVTGLVTSAAIRPRGNASLQAGESGLVFVSPDPGRYEIEVHSRAAVAGARGISRLALAPFLAPAGDFEIAMAEALRFSCPPAIVAEDSVRDGERRVRFALPRGGGAVVEVRRDVMGAEASELLASAVVVTIVELRNDGVLRHDVVLYEVSRGQMDVHELTLPEGLDVERVVTDESEAPAVIVDGGLRIPRTAKLESTGFVLVTSRLEDIASLPLASVVPRTKVRARYLATASSIAATVAPLPEGAWLRVDLEDLPEALASATPLDVVSAWRLEDTEASASLRVSPRPPAPQLGTVVTERESLTLLTTEGTLVHRERFTVSSRASALGVRLPPGAALWSVRANDTLVRPVERDGALLVPLSPGFGNSGPQTVEIIAVEEQAVPTEKTRLELGLTEVDVPVLAHRWQVMLPAENRYRYASGDLEPPGAAPARSDVGRFAVDATSRAMGMGGSASIWGRVFDPTDSALPGATVTLMNEGTGWSATVTSDRNGGFWFVALPSGSYSLVAQLPGFATARYEGIPLASGRNAAYAIRLDIASIAETVTVTGEAPAVLTERREAEAPAKKAEAGFRDEVVRLKQGLVGGVKPIPHRDPGDGEAPHAHGSATPAAGERDDRGEAAIAARSFELTPYPASPDGHEPASEPMHAPRRG